MVTLVRRWLGAGGPRRLAYVVLLACVVHAVVGTTATALAVARRAVIVPEQAEFLAEMLGRGAPGVGGCTFARGDIEESTVSVAYACPAGETVVEVAHPDVAEGTLAKTERFALRVVSGSPPTGFRDELVKRIDAREAAFSWTWIGSDGLSPTDWFAGIGAIVLAIAALIAVALAVAYRRLFATPSD